MEDDREEWRRRARAAFKEKGWGAQAECARAIGKSESAVSHVISGLTKSSDLMLPISKWLGIAPPTIGLTDLDREMHEAWNNLDAKRQRRALKILKLLEEEQEDDDDN